MSDKKASLMVLQLVHDPNLDETDLIVMVSNALDHKLLSRKGVTLVGIQSNEEIELALKASAAILSKQAESKGVPKGERKEGVASKILAFVGRASPKVAAWMKGRPWWHVYVAICGVILAISLARSLILEFFF